MNTYVYFATVSGLILAGCAYGTVAGEQLEPKKDAGSILHADAGHDAKPIIEAATQDVSQELPDVQQQTCNPLPLGTGIPLCDSCLGSNCCSEDQACGGDQDCMAYISCVNGCFPTDGGPPDQQCAANCDAQYPTGSNELRALDTCLQQSCQSTCM